MKTNSTTHLLQKYFQSIGPTKEKKNGDSRSERSTEYYDSIMIVLLAKSS